MRASNRLRPRGLHLPARAAIQTTRKDLERYYRWRTRTVCFSSPHLPVLTFGCSLTPLQLAGLTFTIRSTILANNTVGSHVSIASDRKRQALDFTQLYCHRQQHPHLAWRFRRGIPGTQAIARLGRIVSESPLAAKSDPSPRFLANGEALSLTEMSEACI
jgi:hypothetical protein